MKYRIVTAVRQEDKELMHRVLGDEFEVILCTSLSEALAALSPEVDFIACGVHFDDGRMFDLLRHVKAQQALAAIPFWGILRDEGKLSTAITRGIRTAMKTLGANGLFNLSQMGQAGDPDLLFRQLREAIRHSLADRKAKPAS